MLLNLWQDGQPAHDEAKDQVERDEKLVDGASIALQINKAFSLDDRD